MSKNSLFWKVGFVAPVVGSALERRSYLHDAGVIDFLWKELRVCIFEEFWPLYLLSQD